MCKYAIAAVYAKKNLGFDVTEDEFKRIFFTKNLSDAVNGLFGPLIEDGVMFKIFMEETQEQYNNLTPLALCQAYQEILAEFWEKKK